MAEIDPHIRGLLDAMTQSGFALPDPITPEGLRAALDNPIPGPPVKIAETRDLSIETGQHVMPARLYRGAADDILPLVLFFHGGGWVHGTLDMYDRLCAVLAKYANCAVVSVDYRLAPEYPFPAAFEDAMSSLKWVKTHHADLGIDASRIALAGDSCGGNIAAAAAQTAAGDPSIVHQLLLYPALDGSCSSASYSAEHHGFLTAAQMQWYWEQYAPGDLRNDARASPSLAEVSPETASTTVILAGNDPLHDEGAAFASKLETAGVPVSLHDYPGAIHGFASLFGIVPLSDEAVLAAASALKGAFDI